MAHFVAYAPSQTGNTTALRALATELTGSGRYAALWFSCEAGEAAGDDFEAAQRLVLGDLRIRAEHALPKELWPPPCTRTPAKD